MWSASNILSQWSKRIHFNDLPLCLVIKFHWLSIFQQHFFSPKTCLHNYSTAGRYSQLRSHFSLGTWQNVLLFWKKWPTNWFFFLLNWLAVFVDNSIKINFIYFLLSIRHVLDRYIATYFLELHVHFSVYEVFSWFSIINITPEMKSKFITLGKKTIGNLYFSLHISPM